MGQSIEEEFYDLYYSLDKEAILRLKELDKSGAFNNVLVGLEAHLYGLMLVEDVNKIVYRLYYINGETELEGHLLELSIDNPKRDNLLFYFSQYISHKHKAIDPINAFNTFQQQTRTMLEQMDYLTISRTELRDIGDSSATILAKGKKGIVEVSYIDRLQFYLSMFENRASDTIKEGVEFVYLMLNKRNGLIKIGKSINPSYREKTLHSEEPEIVLICYWVAPGTVEKELHQKYSTKRERGEWFKLTFSDLNEIKETMKVYD
jgi:hypothetical protein